MSDDEQEQEVDNRTIRGNSKTDDRRRVSKSRSRDLDEALGGERESPRTRSTSQWPRTRPDADANRRRVEFRRRVENRSDASALSRERPSIANRRCTRLHCSLHRYYHRRLEESLSDGRLLGASIAAAFIIDPLFFWGYTLFGGEITDPTAAVRLFFEGGFRPERVLILALLSVAVGVVGAVAVVSGDFAYAARERLQRRFDVNSHPHQPWVGSLKRRTSFEC